MDFEEKELQKIDLFVLLEDFIKEAKRRLALLLVLVLIGGSVLGVRS